jgi:hypothetical protein
MEPSIKFEGETKAKVFEIIRRTFEGVKIEIGGTIAMRNFRTVFFHSTVWAIKSKI